MIAPDIAQQIACVEREIRFRETVYPRRVAVGKMSVTQAREQLALMRAVLETLRSVEAGERLL